jgi:hypothetical protein
VRANEIAKVENIENLFFYISDEVLRLTRSVARTVPFTNPDEQSSKFKGQTMREPSKRKIIPNKLITSENWEMEKNTSQVKTKTPYRARVRTVS